MKAQDPRLPALAGLLCSVLACSAGTPVADRNAPAKFAPVKPVSRSSAIPANAPSSASGGASLRIGNGRFFSYALPQGWRVAEDGQYALTLAAADNKALTVMVGNAGYPPNYSPRRFVYEKLMALQPQNLQVSEPTPAKPVAGFAQAYQFDVTYAIGGVPCRGVVKCHVATSYDTAVMVMTAALSEANQWPGYSSWLPLVAEQISATGGAAFGKRGIMAQSLQNSTAYGEAAREYRDWSRRTSQQVTDDRNASEDRKNFAVRENLGGIQTYNNPYGTGPALELPTTYKYYWIDRQNNVVGSDDPSANPNTESTVEWRRLQRHQP